MSCFELFYEDSPREKITQSQRDERGWKQYGWKRVVEERVGAIANGRTSVLFQFFFPMSNGADNQTAIITGLRERKTPSGLSAPAPTPSNTHWKAAEKALDFVIATYRARRPHWTPEFLEKLKQTAREYLNESTYISVQDRGGFSDAPLRGSLRLIKEKNGILPMEKYLGIEINSHGALKVEPGNFAIDKKFSGDAWPEIMMQLWSKAARELETGRVNHYYTYADEYSLSLYSQLGFTEIPASEIKLQNGTKLVDGKILVDGIWWTPMQASQKTLDGLLGLHVDRLTRRGKDSDEANALLSRRDELETAAANADRFLRGTGTVEGVPVAGQLEIQKKDTISLILRLDQPHDLVSAFGHLNADAIPLKEGEIRSTWIRDQLITYHNGVLRFESRDGSPYVTEIETTPGLTVITALRQYRKGPNPELIEIHF
jgi:hypothetical protein